MFTGAPGQGGKSAVISGREVRRALEVVVLSTQRRAQRNEVESPPSRPDGPEAALQLAADDDGAAVSREIGGRRAIDGARGGGGGGGAARGGAPRPLAWSAP